MELINSRESMREQGSRMLGNQFKAALLLFISSLLLIPFSAKCQTWDEVFKQKETQKKYLMEQIVALKIYAGYLKEGYEIVGTGLQTVKDISNGEFKLHSYFISSLKTASPAIRNDIRVAEIIAFQIQIRNAFKGFRESENLSASERSYIQSVKSKVMKECTTDLEHLLLVVTSGSIEMTEGERIQRLEKIHKNMSDKSAFTQSFCDHVHALTRQKENEQQSLNKTRKLYENE
jgi:hypothetical protein